MSPALLRRYTYSFLKIQERVALTVPKNLRTQRSNETLEKLTELVCGLQMLVQLGPLVENLGASR